MSHHSVVSKLARHYDRLAEHYDSAMDRFEGWLLGDWRAWAAAQAHGRTLEIAIGTGRTLLSILRASRFLVWSSVPACSSTHANEPGVGSYPFSSSGPMPKRCRSVTNP